MKTLPPPSFGLSSADLAADRRFVSALARGLEVLSCFRSGEQLLGNQEIAERCALPKSTVSRLTFTLTALGYLRHLEREGKYRLGTASLALGSAMLSKLDVRQLARPLMRRLAALTQAEVALATRDRASMLYLEHCPSPHADGSPLDMGTRLPLATTAIGRAWLAACPATERAGALEYLRSHAPEQWRAAQDQLLHWPEPRAILRPWVCESFGDWRPEVHAIAMAFAPGRGLPLMAISCGGVSPAVTPERLVSARPELERTVRRLQQIIDRA